MFYDLGIALLFELILELLLELLLELICGFWAILELNLGLIWSVLCWILELVVDLFSEL
jgi:hypothetical protein